MWTGHYLQLWEGLLHSGWVYIGWRSTRDVEEERSEGHRAGWHAAGGEENNARFKLLL